MIKTIKVEKKLRLDELIKYVVDKGLNSFQFTSDNNVDVYFSSNGHFIIAGDSNGNGRSVELADKFTVEVEEEITEDTVLEHTVIVLSGNEIIVGKHVNTNIKAIKHRYATVEQIHTLVENKLELIWEV